jgi:hypothetical protein
VNTDTLLIVQVLFSIKWTVFQLYSVFVFFLTSSDQYFNYKVYSWLEQMQSTNFLGKKNNSMGGLFECFRGKIADN